VVEIPRSENHLRRNAVPIIKRPAASPKIVAIESQLEEPLLTTLKAYCEFIDSTPHHVLATATLASREGL
jgi:hypothetical protein